MFFLTPGNTGPEKKARDLPRRGKASILVPAMRRMCGAVAFLLLLGAFFEASAAPQSVAADPAGTTSPEAGLARTPSTGADTGVSPGIDFDPTALIGLDLKAALDSLGTPKEVFSYRGQDDTQDNVVFFYPDYLYLFWYRNRVWQVRCDHRFARPLFGVAMGMPREVIERTSTRQFAARGDSLYFDLDDAKYPIRVRLVFSNNALADLYVYRSDF